MVDNRYWGRSPDGKRPLHDPEIRRLLESRATRNRSFDHDLATLTETFDQISPQDRKAGHVFLLARPTMPANALPSVPVSAWPQIVSHTTTMRYADFEGLSGVFNRLPHRMVPRPPARRRTSVHGPENSYTRSQSRTAVISARSMRCPAPARSRAPISHPQSPQW